LMHRLPYHWEKYLPDTDHLEKLKKPY
jgi:hypothetical protein